jgi:anti-sigma-K factor RskA
VDIQVYIQSGIIESYVLGLANAEEIAELEAMRLQYPEVDEAIFRFSEMLEKNAIENAVAPPVGIKERILSEVKEKKTTASVVSIDKGNEKHLQIALNSIRPWRMTAAAAVILLIVSAAINFYLYRQYNEKDEAYQALLTERNTLQASNNIYQTKLNDWQSAAAMMADPAMFTLKMNGVPGQEANMATLFWDTRNKDVYVMPNKLPHAEAGKQYQLWAIVNGKPVDAGTLDPDCPGVCKMKNIPSAEAFAITLEKQGGSPTPTLAAMLVKASV